MFMVRGSTRCRCGTRLWMGLDDSRLAKETYLNLSSETRRNNDSEDPFKMSYHWRHFSPSFILYSLIHQELIYCIPWQPNFLSRYHGEHLEQLCPILDITGPSQEWVWDPLYFLPSLLVATLPVFAHQTDWCFQQSLEGIQCFIN